MTLKEKYTSSYLQTTLALNGVLGLVYLVLFIVYRYKSSSIGPLSLQFLNLLIAHIFIVYLELRINYEVIFPVLNYVIHVIIELVLIFNILALWFFSPFVESQYNKYEIVDEKEAVQSYLNSEILFTVIYAILIFYYTLKIILMRDQKVLAQQGMSKRISYIDFEDKFDQKNHDLIELK